jgi:hypothetical protein
LLHLLQHVQVPLAAALLLLLCTLLHQHQVLVLQGEAPRSAVGLRVYVAASRHRQLRNDIRGIHCCVNGCDGRGGSSSCAGACWGPQGNLLGQLLPKSP